MTNPNRRHQRNWYLLLSIIYIVSLYLPTIKTITMIPPNSHVFYSYLLCCNPHGKHVQRYGTIKYKRSRTIGLVLLIDIRLLDLLDTTHIWYVFVDHFYHALTTHVASMHANNELHINI